MSNYNKVRARRLQESLGLTSGRRPAEAVSKSKNNWIWYGVYGLLLVSVLVFNSLFMITRVDGQSMAPTLKSGSVILVKRSEKVRRFDIVALVERVKENGSSKNIIKRVIGLPGDTITVLNGTLYINDSKYEEPYLQEKFIKEYKKSSYTLKVPKDMYFVLGDNRDVSKDSRQVGSFVKKSVIGVAMVDGNTND
jgi:signal peptidase I